MTDGAYLRTENWPECIPWTEPTREYGPYAWRPPTHDNPGGIDTYPNSHPDAASVGHDYLGDVCPFCGVPIAWTETVVTTEGVRGVFADITAVGDPIPAYHPECWDERSSRIASEQFHQLTEYQP